MKKLERYRIIEEEGGGHDLWPINEGRWGFDTESVCKSVDVDELEAALAEAVELLVEAKQHVSGWTSTGEDIAAFLDKHGGEDA